MNDARRRLDRAPAGLFRRGDSGRSRATSARSRARFALSVTGASLYAAATVGATVVLGRVTEKVILPAFDGGVTKSTVIGGLARAVRASAC